MYDFNFGSREDIEADPESFLLFVKRLLPRWANGIPDSECLAIFRALALLPQKNKVLIETGSGASSLAMFLHCALNGGEMYSWDTNGSKGHYLRSVVSDAICRPLGVDVHNIWKFVAFNSTDRFIGIEALGELGKEPVFGYFDSWHTLDHLTEEVDKFLLVADTSRCVVALDDAYFTKRHSNFSYVNMLRNKIGLQPVSEPDDNVCDPYYLEIGALLKARFDNVKHISDTYKAEYETDIFFDYYSQDRKYMNKLGLEEKRMLAHRFDAFLIEE